MTAAAQTEYDASGAVRFLDDVRFETRTPAVCRICSLRKNPSNGELGLATSNCLQVRNSFSDGGNITAKTVADLAKNRKRL
jgi:hypothetical protein